MLGGSSGGFLLPPACTEVLASVIVNAAAMISFFIIDSPIFVLKKCGTFDTMEIMKISSRMSNFWAKLEAQLILDVLSFQ
ncbi:hypothetical protein [Planctobacterium marinum]|uniref:hypothetical protein n=1 Tax=Planctobacterium marinum TaxID=1631968 RepID=UPI001E4681E9|nr:hypothetical protein [Planctobacterium marinum]MCC2603785.1 hypothetical protein [Planctobacterium marinum]